MSAPHVGNILKHDVFYLTFLNSYHTASVILYAISSAINHMMQDLDGNI